MSELGAGQSWEKNYPSFTALKVAGRHVLEPSMFLSFQICSGFGSFIDSKYHTVATLPPVFPRSVFIGISGHFEVAISRNAVLTSQILGQERSPILSKVGPVQRNGNLIGCENLTLSRLSLLVFQRKFPTLRKESPL